MSCLGHKSSTASRQKCSQTGQYPWGINVSPHSGQSGSSWSSGAGFLQLGQNRGPEFDVAFLRETFLGVLIVAASGVERCVGLIVAAADRSATEFQHNLRRITGQLNASGSESVVTRPASPPADRARFAATGPSPKSFGVVPRHHLDHVDRARAGGDGQQAAFARVSQTGGPGPAQVERSLQGKTPQRLPRLGLKQLQDRITVPRANQVIDVVNRTSLDSAIRLRADFAATGSRCPRIATRPAS